MDSDIIPSKAPAQERGDENREDPRRPHINKWVGPYGAKLLISQKDSARNLHSGKIVGIFRIRGKF